jgi:hypothetical protein
MPSDHCLRSSVYGLAVVMTSIDAELTMST